MANIVRLTTESGSFYTINLDKNTWSKNLGGKNSITAMFATEYWTAARNYPDLSVYEWAELTGEARVPQVGECLFIQGRGMNEWWATTQITKVEYLETENDAVTFE